MGLSNSKIWWPNSDFVCPKCGAFCMGEIYSKILSDGITIKRWCDCRYLEYGKKDPHDYISRSVTALELEKPKVLHDPFFYQKKFH